MQDRPKSAVDQIGFGEREVGRTRMSVEEQLDRLRRNQEASLLREKKKETPTRSPSFSKDNPFLLLQVCLSRTLQFRCDLCSLKSVNSGFMFPCAESYPSCSRCRPFGAGGCSAAAEGGAQGAEQSCRRSRKLHRKNADCCKGLDLFTFVLQCTHNYRCKGSRQ